MMLIPLPITSLQKLLSLTNRKSNNSSNAKLAKITTANKVKLISNSREMSIIKSSNTTKPMTNTSPEIFISDTFEGYPISSFCLQHVPAEDLDSVLIPGGLVRDRIERLGFDISAQLAHEEFIFLCVLKGGFQFFNQLLEVVRSYHRFNADQSLKGITAGKARRIEAEFIRLISYEDDVSIGQVRIIGLENLSSLKGKNVIIVEDIIDSGLTMRTLLRALDREEPKSVKVAALFYKRTPKNIDNYRPDYVGFSIPDWFIVGCNLDYNNYFRDLQHVCVISNHGKQRYRQSILAKELNGAN